MTRGAGSLAALLLAAALAGPGCGGASAWPSLVRDADVGRADGAPSIVRIRDLGDVDITTDEGPLPKPDGDEVFVLGELILVEGDNFGKLPTVTIGGRPAEIVARTSGSGIVSRIPDGVPSGTVQVEVSHPKGKAAKEIWVRRYALVTQPAGDKVHPFDVGREDAEPKHRPLAMPNPRHVRFSSDGAVAYVVSGGAEAGKGGLTLVSMTAGGGPRVIRTLPMEDRAVVALAAAERAPLLAVIGEGDLQLFSLRDPENPAPYNPVPLPAEAAGGVLAADLDPSGKVLVLLVAKGNRVVAIDVSAPEAPKGLGLAEVLPGQKASLVRDLRFGPDGKTLWVLAGDDAGRQPIRLTAIRVEAPDGAAGDGKLTVVRTTSLPAAQVPLHLAVARGTLLASGALSRSPPENAAVFVSGVQAKLFQLGKLDLFDAGGKKKATALLAPMGDPGMFVRANSEGAGEPFAQVPALVSSVDLSPDSQVLLATTCRVTVANDELRPEFGVTVTPLWGGGAPRFVKLADVGVEWLKPPFVFGQVRIQH